MPAGGRTCSRSSDLPLLGRLAQEKFIDPAVGKLLDELEKAELNEDDAALVRITRLDYEQASKSRRPAVRFYRAFGLSAYQKWAAARLPTILRPCARIARENTRF